MKYCKHCGAEIGDARFCPHCGKPQNAEQPKMAGGKRLHCPHCRSSQLIAVMESDTTNGVATHSRVTKRFGVTSYSANTVNRHYWMCKECGHKFRNLEDLGKELEGRKKSCKVLTIFSILLGIACLFVLFLIASEPSSLLLVGFPMLMLLGLEAFLIIGSIVDKKAIERMTADKAYLEAHCFD